MPHAIWNGAVIADAPREATEVVDGYAYFPVSSVRMEYLQPSDTRTVCGWKGTATYYHVAVDGAVSRDAAWCYQETLPEAKHIEGRIAFWKGVQLYP